ncbi:MAG: patatin family protein, partial [Clostridia bacterium]|nr:patatin family protein [Clostridia bacterium]
FSKDEMKKDFDALRASSSIPLLSPIVHINSMELLDGGVADPIPIRKSLQDGNRKNVIVLTRNRDYSKKPVRFYRLFQSKYRKYPELLNAIRNRHVVYNETLRFIEALERDGSAIVIRPSKPLQVDRLEKNPEKLLELYDNGYQDTEELLERINTFSTATNR